jgi:hypothetical protein
VRRETQKTEFEKFSAFYFPKFIISFFFYFVKEAKEFFSKH